MHLRSGQHPKPTVLHRPVELTKAFFGPEKYERLVALKDKYDPVNLFRLNQNIKPSQELPQPVS